MNRNGSMALLAVLFAFGVLLEMRVFLRAKKGSARQPAAAEAVLRQETRAEAQTEAQTEVGAAVAPTPRGSCVGSDLKLQLPLDGKADRDWVIANYFDQDPAIGQIRDYSGATGDDALTYDGHTGIDIEIPNFRRMDQGVPVLASADGTVEEIYDQSPDRNRTCSSERWNYVKVRHRNGYATDYGHLRKNSIVVAVGQRVSTGTRLGLVGSSGCSSYPHVHLEVVDCLEHPLDIMLEHLFASPPPYSASVDAALMDVAVYMPQIDSVLQIQDSGTEDYNTVPVNGDFSVGITVSHLRKGDVVRIEFREPDNSVSPVFFEQTNDHAYPRTHWWGNFKLDKMGPWMVIIRVNGHVIGDHPLTVTP